jgi:sulfur carrier protein ThiS adenylyltransferase
MHDTWVTKENIDLLFSVCDVVVEAFDEAEQKSMLIEYMLTNLPDIPLVAASGMAGFGRTELIKIVQSVNLYVCGDEESEISEENPPLAPRVSIVANMQADIVLQLLLKDAF